MIIVGVVADIIYITRVMNNLNKTHYSEIQLECFTQTEKLKAELESRFFNVVLFDESKKDEVDVNWFRGRNIVFAWLTSDRLATFQDEKAIAKYQSQDDLYRSILALDTGRAGMAIKRDYKMITFCSGSGGSGVTSMSLAYSKYMTERGNKVFYFNLETLNSFSAYLSGNSNHCMDEILYRYQSEEKDDKAKILESLVTRENRGNYFYFGECKNPFELKDADDEVLFNMMEDLVQAGKYTHIVVDINFDFALRSWYMMEKSSTVALILRASKNGLKKTERFVQAIQDYDGRNDTCILAKTKIIYNLCKPGARYRFNTIPLAPIAEFPIVDGDEEQVIQALSVKENWRNL